MTQAAGNTIPMRRKEASRLPAVIDSVTGQVVSHPSQKGIRVKLTTLDDVYREIAKVYREARNGRIASENGTKFVYMLRTLAEVKMLAALKERLAVLERQLGHRELLIAPANDEGDEP